MEDIDNIENQLRQAYWNLERGRTGESSRGDPEQLQQRRITELDNNLVNLNAELASLDNGANNIEEDKYGSTPPFYKKATQVEPILSHTIAPAPNEEAPGAAQRAPTQARYSLTLQNLERLDPGPQYSQEVYSKWKGEWIDFQSNISKLQKIFNNPQNRVANKLWERLV